MKVSMDDEMNAYKLRKMEQTKPSGLKWVFIIALGVFLGNAASFGLERAVLYWELKQVAIAATSVMKESTRKALEQQKRMDAKAVERKRVINEQSKYRELQNQQKRAALRQARETCDFWRQQVRQDNSAKNKRNAEEACNLMNQFR